MHPRSATLATLLLSSLPLLSAILPSSASAAELPTAIIANEGIGFSRMEEGKVIAYDLVDAYDTHKITVADCAAHKADHQSVTWCFASAENQSKFIAATGENGRNPYIPFVGGHCSLGMSLGNFVARGDPRTALRIGDVLVLNGNLDVRTRFLMDTERNMDNARLQYQLGLRNGNMAEN
ncbi:MAG: hypothetical protein Q7U82_03575 [Gammaproteobacteria bacterium]|nr:hypothetical protein [Gammaproteobacteria bacterium]